MGTAASASAQTGASSRASAARPLTEAACVSTTGTRTALWPKRSVKMPISGADRAIETPVTAATMPALP